MSRRFSNPWPHAPHGARDVLRWKLRLGPREHARFPDAPDTPAPWRRLDPSLIATPPSTDWRAVWLGHASFLLQGCGVSLLIDPVFSPYCAPLPLPGLRRLVAPPCTLSELPQIDAVLLTHAHYDHLDLPTLRQLNRSTQLLVPEGHAAWLRRKGFAKVTEVRWHQRVESFPGLGFTATPAQHATARTPTDRDRAHWCGWRIDSPAGSLWHAGDSGYCAGFCEIARRHGPVDFGMIPIGAYQPRRVMRAVHMNPEEAVRVFLDTACRRAHAMHWGTFRLTDEPLGEPPMWLQQVLRERRIDPSVFLTGMIGEMIEISGNPSLT